MKRPSTLTVSEFMQLLDAMSAQATTELTATRARMDSLRAETRPPG